MRVTVAAKTVAGTDRGGEDLYLVFEATECDGTAPVVDLVDGDPSWFRDEEDEEEDEESPLSRWECRTDHYEFEWRGSLQDLADLAVELGVQDPEKWEWSGPASGPPQKRFRVLHFVDGNAD